jgi:hypothetical protein
VFESVKVVFINVILFFHSTIAHSDFEDVNFAFSTVISAVEYIAGDHNQFVVYSHQSTLSVQPPLSDLIAADEFHSVIILTFFAVNLPHHVTMIHHEFLSFVLIVESVIWIFHSQ